MTDSNPPESCREYVIRPNGGVRYLTPIWKAFPQQPVLGTFGFDFPWKNFIKLAEETRKAGWAYVCLSHDMTEERAEQIQILNPYSLVIREYLDTPTIVNYLAGCDANAFMYECANTGTSGAIRTGIAARKPILAFAGCRQFRDLYELDGWYGTGFHWATNWDDFQQRLLSIWPTPWEPTVTKLAGKDSWTQRGRDHAQLYRMLTQGPLKELS